MSITIAVLDDYQDAFRALACVQPLLLQGHTLRVFADTEKDFDRLAARLAGCQAVVLTQQRSAFPRALTHHHHHPTTWRPYRFPAIT